MNDLGIFDRRGDPPLGGWGKPRRHPNSPAPDLARTTGGSNRTGVRLGCCRRDSRELVRFYLFERLLRKKRLDRAVQSFARPLTPEVRAIVTGSATECPWAADEYRVMASGSMLIDGPTTSSPPPRGSILSDSHRLAKVYQATSTNKTITYPI
jgi:hypothetical protein